MTYIDRLINSFDNVSEGFSGRKLSAFAAVTISIVLSYNNTTESNLETILAIWLIFASLCLAIVTVQQVIALKNGKS